MVTPTFESSWLHWPILLNLLFQSWDNSEGRSQLQSYLRHHPEDHWHFIAAQLPPLPSPAPALPQVWIPRALPRKPPASVSSRASFPGSPLSPAKRRDRDGLKKKLTWHSWPLPIKSVYTNSLIPWLSFLRPISISSLKAAYISPSLKSKKKKKKTDDSPGKSSGKGKLIGRM